MVPVDLKAAILIANCAATFALTGIIWIVQLVHYPSFRFVDREKFRLAHDLHTRAISPIVAPLMIAELLTAAALPFIAIGSVPVELFWVGLLLVVFIWISTFLIQVPYHSRLAKGFEEGAVEGLVRSNWIRTLAWSLRSGIALAALSMALAGRL